MSYRRIATLYAARLIYQWLKQKGINVFMDVENIDNGKFEDIILRQIKARHNFILVLGPGTVDRFNRPRDFMRKEIECALRMNKNIIPVLIGNYGLEDAEPYLKGRLKSLKKYQALSMSDEYFEEAMKKLYKRLKK